MLLEYPTATRTHPVARLRRPQVDLDSLFGRLRVAPRVETPPINVWAGLNGVIVTAAVPGVAPESIDIAVHRDVLTLRGERKPEALTDDAVVHRQEHIHGPFVRSVVLPFRVNSEAAVARFERGILTLELPRPDEDKPHKIKVARA